MAPSGSTTSSNIITGTTKTTTSKTTQPGRTRYKKKKQNNNSQSKKQEMIKTVSPSRCSPISSQDSSSKEEKMEILEVIDVTNNNSACSTPKGQKFRIPEISTCPPAPKKQRVLSNCSLKRSPLSFFEPPDLDHFFFVALPDVSV